ncbi:hypothetical protein [Streptomyces erythrochromogenes]|uniref:Uncharacterized protein n=1 Tax=Streptomyces erythrochromogenes TaxID=285574 RepID=A0ABZ1Q355_9ACTN|nr:hypothetical protein [Streptomyces erythrochromogenes]
MGSPWLDPTFAVALKNKGLPVPEIAKKLVIKTGKNAGKSPSVASLYRALAEAEEATADDGLPMRPTPVRIRRPGDPLTAEEIDLRDASRPSTTRTRRSAADPMIVLTDDRCTDVPRGRTRNRPRGLPHAGRRMRTTRRPRTR